MNGIAKSVLSGSRYAIPHMQKADGGSIINTASKAGFASDAVRSVYGASTRERSKTYKKGDD